MGDSTRCEVKPSLLPGSQRGVFATRDFKRGELVCYYHGYYKEQPNKTEWDYTLALGDRSLVGYIHPREPDCCAQLANDCTMPSLEDFPIGASPDVQRKYVLLAFIKAQERPTNITYNTQTETADKIPFYAICDIKQGEELYFNYGIEYWLKKLMLQSKNNNNNQLTAILQVISYQLSADPRLLQFEREVLSRVTDESLHIRMRLLFLFQEY